MEIRQEVVTNAAQTSLELARFVVERDSGASQSRVVVGAAQKPAKASLFFDPTWVWSKALADLLDASPGGATVSREDVADSLKLLALKLRAGDKNFIMQSLVGQVVLLEQLAAEAARDHAEAEAARNWKWGRIRLREYLVLQKALVRVLSAIAAIQARPSSVMA